MGTLTAIYGWIAETAGIRVADDAEVRQGAGDEYRVRPLPNEDIYLYVKAIDNSRVMAQVEPRATRAALKSIVASLAIVTGLFLILLPVALNVHAGYRYHALELERQQLDHQRALLEREEEALLSPERLAELAAEQALVDPAPEDRVPLRPADNGALAMKR